jgi:hypothetical protein
LRDYLKLRDLDRYMTLMQDRIFTATADFLESRGISSARFTERVRNIQNYYTGNAFGNDNTVINSTAARADLASPGKAN